MKSKITTTWIALFAIASGVQAQDFGLKAGPSFNKISNLFEENSSSQGPGFESRSDNNYILGFSVSGTLEFKLNDNFGIATGLTFRQAGTKGSMTFSYADPNNGGSSFEGSSVLKLTTNHLEIPVQLKAGFMAGDVKVYGLFGAYAGLGLAGKYTVDSEYTETYMGETFTDRESDTEKIEFGFDKDKADMQSLNFGLLPGIGIEFKKIQIEATYNLGLSDPFFDSDEVSRYQSINLTIGYRLN